MHPPWKIETRALVKLALPVMTVQVGMMSMGFVDTVMVGHYSDSHLAAAGLANFYSILSMMFGIGVLMSLDPVLSQAVGAADEGAVTRNLQRGVVLAFALVVPVTILYLFSSPVLLFFGQSPELVELAADYIWMQIPGILPFYCFTLLRSTLQAYHLTAAVLWTILLANLLNAGLNYVLIFGHLGVAPMGLQGSAIATMASRWVMFIGLLAMCGGLVRTHLTRWTRAAVDRVAMWRLVRVGAPVGVQIVLEFSAFGATLLFMGWISKDALAGHQVAITLASFSYMLPLGISVATGVRVGNGVGRGDASGARWSAAVGLVLGVAIMVCFALVFLLLPEPLTDMFLKVDARGAREVCLLLLPIAAVFQVVDGMQVVSLGALRGVADTKIPMLINLVGFWCLGIPTGYWLAFEGGMGPEGLWWGLTVGLAVVAVFLVLRVWILLRGEIRRVDVDGDPVSGLDLDPER